MNDRFSSFQELKDALEMTLEINFSFHGKNYLIEPDPKAPYGSDRLIITRLIITDLANLDAPHSLKNAQEALDYKIDGKKLSSIWSQLTNVDC